MDYIEMMDLFKTKLDGTREIFFNTEKLIQTIEDDKKVKTIWKRIIIENEVYDYEVSNTGKVRHIITKEPLQKLSPDDRYYRVSLYKSRNNRKFIGIHRLMALMFIPVPKKYIKAGYTIDQLVVNHKDGFKRHNMLYNLEWCTIKENMDHAINSNLIGYLGENSHLAKIDENTAIKICELISQGKNNEFISNKLNVTKKMVQHIRNRECWKHISKDYEFPKLSNFKPYTTNPDTIHNICKLLEMKKYSDPEIGLMVGKSREYVKDIRLRKRNTKISVNYVF